MSKKLEYTGKEAKAFKFIGNVQPSAVVEVPMRLVPALLGSGEWRDPASVPKGKIVKPETEKEG